MSGPKESRFQEVRTGVRQKSPGKRTLSVHAADRLDESKTSEGRTVPAAVDGLRQKARSMAPATDPSEIDFDRGMKSFDKIIRRDAVAFRALAK